MQRREFIALLGGAAAHGQRCACAAVIGDAGHRLSAFRRGRAEHQARRRLPQGPDDAGLVEGKNVAIEFRWAEGKDDRLAGIGGRPDRQRVAVIATLSSTVAAVAAKKATSTVPIYFLIADPPVELGLVTSLNRPGGNATGITTLAAEVAAETVQPVARAGAASSQHGGAAPADPSQHQAGHGEPRGTANTLGVRSTSCTPATTASSRTPIARSSPASRCWSAPIRSSSAPRADRRAIGAPCGARRSMTAGVRRSRRPDELWTEPRAAVGSRLAALSPASSRARSRPTCRWCRPPIFETVINLKAAKALGLAIPTS